MPLLVLLFIAVPLVELYVIIQVGQAIGVLPTIALLFLDSILGAALVRSQGRAAWLRFNRALSERRVPAREVFDGALIIFGGALLLTPGFITDVFGLLLLIPPTRAAIRRTLSTVARRRMAMGGRVVFWGYDRYAGRRAPGPSPAPGPWTPEGQPGAGGPVRPYDYDYEGSAREIKDEGELPRRTGEHGER